MSEATKQRTWRELLMEDFKATRARSSDDSYGAMLARVDAWTACLDQLESQNQALDGGVAELNRYIDELVDDLARRGAEVKALESCVLEAESLNRKHSTETTSIHNDMLALAQLVGVHYDGVSSPSGFLHGDIMPAIQRLEESRVIAEHLYKLTRAEKQALARRNNDLKLALHTAQQDLQRLASPTRFYSGTDWDSEQEHRSRLQFATAANAKAIAALGHGEPKR